MKSPLIAALRIPSFFFLIVSGFFSQFAMNLLNFTLLIVAFQLSSSNLAVAGIVLAFTLPSIFFGIVAGVFVDKWNKKHVLVYTNILRAMVVFPLIFVSQDLALVYFLTFLVSLITQFFIPAEAPMIPQLVPKKLLISANSIFGMGLYGSLIVAYALSGPLLLVIGKINVFILIIILFAISVFFAKLIKIKHKEHLSKKKIHLYKEIKLAIKIVMGNKNVFHSLFMLVILQTLVLVIVVIGPSYATEILNIQVEKFPLLFVGPSIIGLIIGAVLIGNFLHNKNKSTLTKLGLLGVGSILILIVNLSKFMDYDPVKILIPLAVAIGFAFSFVFIPSHTIIQEETKDEQRGKIYGSLNNLVGIISLIPVLGVGLLADRIGVISVVTFIGIGIIIFSVVRIVKFK